MEDELLIDEAVETAEEILDYALPWIYRELDEKKNVSLLGFSNKNMFKS